MSEVLKLGWLFKDTLYLHGDRGNVLALQKMTNNYGLDLEITNISHETEGINFVDFDVLYCPPGEIINFPSIIDYLRPHLEEITSFLDSGKPMLVIGTSAAIFAKKTVRCDGTEVEGLGIIDVVCHENETVYGDDLYYQADYNNSHLEITGIQIQMIDIEIQDGEPFGKMFYGYGNNGKTIDEGVLFKNAIFTNALGPILVTNPWLSKSIIELVIGNKQIQIELADPDMTLEEKSFESKKGFIMTKKTNLTNCPRESSK